MNTFELETWDDERRLCTFYTVHTDGEAENETDKFLIKYENDVAFEKSIQELLSFIIYAIGDDHGAVDEFFNRYENEVSGLPLQGRIKLGSFTYHYPQFPLRLYALKITEGIVVLFNGGVKDGATNQTSGLNIKWREACLFARKILEALRAGEILINEKERKLTNHLGENTIIL